MDLSENVFYFSILACEGLPGASAVKNLPANAGDAGLILGEGNGYPLQHSCLENLWTEEPGGLRSVGVQRVPHN